MKRLTVLLAVVLLFSGGTSISKKQFEKKQTSKSSIEKLKEVASKLDTTSAMLNHSTTALKNL